MGETLPNISSVVKPLIKSDKNNAHQEMHALDPQ